MSKSLRRRIINQLSILTNRNVDELGKFYSSTQIGKLKLILEEKKMTDEQIKQNAEKYASENYHPYGSETNPQYLIVSEDSFIAGAHSRDEEVNELEKKVSALETVIVTARATISTQEEIIKELRNPWVTDRDPEIKGSISDAVLLLVDGMFYKVSRLERRKDGSEFWWGVDVVNGDEVTAWMPIPQEPNND